MSKAAKTVVMTMAVIGICLSLSVSASAEVKKIVIGPQVKPTVQSTPMAKTSVQKVGPYARPQISQEAKDQMFRQICETNPTSMCQDIDDDGVYDGTIKKAVDPAIADFMGSFDTPREDPYYWYLLSPETKKYSHWFRVIGRVGDGVRYVDPSVDTEKVLWANSESAFVKQTGIKLEPFHNGYGGWPIVCPEGKDPKSIRVNASDEEVQKQGCNRLALACMDPDNDNVCSQDMWVPKDYFFGEPAHTEYDPACNVYVEHAAKRPNLDNCPYAKNLDQKTHGQSFYGVQGDGILIGYQPAVVFGDACTVKIAGVDYPDTDGDGVQDDKDNCPMFKNADQAPSKDNNMIGRACSCADHVCKACERAFLYRLGDDNEAKLKTVDSDNNGFSDYCDYSVFNLSHAYFNWLKRVGITK